MPKVFKDCIIYPPISNPEIAFHGEKMGPGVENTVVYPARAPPMAGGITHLLTPLHICVLVFLSSPPDQSEVTLLISVL